MTQIIVLPHHELCPEGAVLDGEPGTSICDVLLENGIEIEHACEKSCACTTCHVVIREGYNSLEAADETEEDLLARAECYEVNRDGRAEAAWRDLEAFLAAAPSRFATDLR